MKQIFIVTEEFRPSKKGGIATWSYGLAEYFSKRDYDVTIFVKKRHGINISKIKKKIPYKIHLIRGRDWAYFKKWYVRFAIKKFITKATNPIIISSNWELSEGIIPFKNKLKFKLITALHGLEVTRLNSDKYIKRRKNFIETLNKSDIIVSVSNYTKNEAIKISKNNIIVVPNFVNLKEYYPVDNYKILKEYDLSEKDIIILSFSRLIKRKGHHVVIKSLKYINNEISNYKYLIAGTGDQRYKKELKLIAKEIGVEKNIRFLGYIDENKKNNIYNLCDLYIMNSLPTDIHGNSEGFGITFLEANACGKPVIGTNVGGVSDAIKNGVNGFLIEPNNPKKTALAIIKTLKNKKKYDSLSKKALSRVRNDFDIEYIGKKYQLIIDKLYDFE